MDFGICGRSALVLGSSQGLGLATASALIQEGVKVTLAGRDQAKLTAAAVGIGSDVEPLVLDLTRPRSIEQAQNWIAVNKPDILVNNSGGPAPGAAATVASEDWSRQFETMVNAIIAITRSSLPGMRERTWGRIINIVSSGVEQPIPNLAISNALRSAIVGWAKTLANEVACEGVTVNCLVPGRIHTSRVDELDAAAAKRNDSTAEAVAKASVATIPAGRYGRPEEFAAVAAFLASAPASYITGSLIRVDGGSIRSI